MDATQKYSVLPIGRALQARTSGVIEDKAPARYGLEGPQREPWLPSSAVAVLRELETGEVCGRLEVWPCPADARASGLSVLGTEKGACDVSIVSP